MEAYDIHTWKVTAVLLIVLLFFLTFLFRGFLQEWGKDIYIWMRSHFAQRSAPASEPSTKLEIQYATPPRQEPEPTPHVPDLTLAKIKEDMAKVPPMGRDSFANRYLNIRVDWLLYFRSGSEAGGRFRLSLSSTQKGLTDVTCAVDAHDYPQFRILHQGAPLKVSGVIKSWFLGDPVLEDVRITVLPDATP